MKPTQNTCSCGAAWTGHQACHCAACHLTYAGEDAFVRHRRDLACVDPATAVRRDGTLVFELNRRGHWTATVSDDTRERLARLNASRRTGPNRRGLEPQEPATGSEALLMVRPDKGPQNPVCGSRGGDAA